MRPSRMTMQPIETVANDDAATEAPLRMTMTLAEPLPLRRAKATESPLPADDRTKETAPA